MDVKITVFFKSDIGKGWTETFYKSGVDDQTTVANLIMKNEGLIKKRLAILPFNVSIKGARIANVDSIRDGLPVALTGNTGIGTWRVAGHGVTENSLDVDTAINVRCFAAFSQWRNYLIRGLPVAALTEGGGNVAAGPWKDLLDAYITQIKADGYAIRISARNPSIDVTSLTLAAGKVTQVVTSAVVPNFIPGGTLEVYGAKGIKPVNGRYRVTEILPNFTYTVASRLRHTVGTLTANTARARYIAFSYLNIARTFIIGVANRQTGRPSDAPRGRALVQRD